MQTQYDRDVEDVKRCSSGVFLPQASFNVKEASETPSFPLLSLGLCPRSLNMCVREGFMLCVFFFFLLSWLKLRCHQSEDRKMQQRHLSSVGLFSSLFFPPHDWETTFSFFFLGLPCCAFDLCYDDILRSASVGQFFFFSKTSILEVWAAELLASGSVWMWRRVSW